ncbi:uncharacterized protein LOC128892071 [Hylaeus anthracinus]|uniref:uncharacterized protein LOC128892071 n=1 Tax=Hylaeus anthracinus TaxID=313031 RepID=UPI0023B889CF|nr:uncharacterized protein LOC128892071 [Hylaeus anthracinus]
MVRRKADPRSHTNSKSNRETSRTRVLVNNGKNRRRARVLNEIRYLRKSIKLIIPKLPFVRLVKQIIMECSVDLKIDRIQAFALEALHEATEAYLVQFFEDCNLLIMHAKRATLMIRDMHLMRILRGRSDIINR